MGWGRVVPRLLVPIVARARDAAFPGFAERGQTVSIKPGTCQPTGQVTPLPNVAHVTMSSRSWRVQ